MDIADTRRARLKRWIKDNFQGKQVLFLAEHEMNQGELSALLSKKSFGEKKARALEKLAKMPPGWLDQPDENVTVNLTPSGFTAGARYDKLDKTVRKIVDASFEVAEIAMRDKNSVTDPHLNKKLTETGKLPKVKSKQS